MTFKELNLIEPIQKALAEEGYDTPTPIQQQAIPHALQGRDLLGCAQTGTGKTAAFAIPVLQNLQKILPPPNQPRKIKALVLTPTRELAIQIGDSFKAYGRHIKINGLVIFGGVSQKPQEVSLKRGIDVLVATPGRLLDLMNQGFISLSNVEIFVLDEADRMLDMGFIHDVRKVIKALPTKRQTLFFSATMPDEITGLANDILSDPVHVAVTPVSSTAEKVQQSIYFVEKKKKKKLLSEILQDQSIVSALVFTRTKHGANKVVKELGQSGITAMAIHGNKSQTARQNALGSFKDGNLRVLVATDIAARGIDVDELSHVINYDLPNIPETYVHRIGRTGRAGLSGVALSFCDVEELPFLKDIQRLIGKRVPVVSDHPFHYDPNNPPLPSHDPSDDDRPPRPSRNGHPKGERGPKPDRNKQGNQPRPNQPNESRDQQQKKQGQTQRKEQPRGERHPNPNNQGGQRDQQQRQQPNNERKEQPRGERQPNPNNQGGPRDQQQRQQPNGERKEQRRGERQPNPNNQGGGQRERPNQEKRQNPQPQGQRKETTPITTDVETKQPHQSEQGERRGKNNNRRTENRKPQAPNTQNPSKPAPEKTDDHTDDGDPKWSSIFKKPNTGTKGFVIKSDRFDTPKKSQKRTFRGKNK